jgi:hypothetical protein
MIIGAKLLKDGNQTKARPISLQMMRILLEIEEIVNMHRLLVGLISSVGYAWRKRRQVRI